MTALRRRKPQRRLELHGSVWVSVGDETLGGSERFGLLRAVASEGSITRAAKAYGISYKSAWDAIEAMNALAGEALVERSVGGRGGGSTRLTERGQRLVERSRDDGRGVGGSDLGEDRGRLCGQRVRAAHGTAGSGAGSARPRPQPPACRDHLRVRHRTPPSLSISAEGGVRSAEPGHVKGVKPWFVRP